MICKTLNFRIIYFEVFISLLSFFTIYVGAHFRMSRVVIFGGNYCIVTNFLSENMMKNQS